MTVEIIGTIAFFVCMGITALALDRTHKKEEALKKVLSSAIPSDRHTYLAAKLCLAPDWLANDYSEATKYINHFGDNLQDILDISNGTIDSAYTIVGSVDRYKYLAYLKEYTNNPNWVILQNNETFADFGIQKVQKKRTKKQNN